MEESAPSPRPSPSFLQLRKNLTSLVEGSGLSVREFAKRMDLPPKVVDRMINSHGDVNPTLGTMELVAEKLGVSVAQLLSPDFASESFEPLLPATEAARPPVAPRPPNRLLARQLGRLIEDFLECEEAGRFEVAALAQELAEQQLRRSLMQSGGASPDATLDRQAPDN